MTKEGNFINKKYKILLIFILVILLLAGAYYFMFHYNKAKVGASSFTVPKGYNVTNQSQNFVKMSNGRDELTLIQEKETNVDAAIKDYKSRYANEYNVTDSEISLSDSIKVKKTVATKTSEDGNKTTNIVKYWFVKDKYVYDIQTSAPNVNDAMIGIINSLK